MISGPLTDVKCAFVSPATALASSVLPVPGGPCSSTPLGASTPICSNSSGCLIGSSTISRIFCTSARRPPRSSYVTRGRAASAASACGPSSNAVPSPTMTGRPGGEVRVTTNCIDPPIEVRSATPSPCVNTWFGKWPAMYSCSPATRTSSVGESTMRSAAAASTALADTLSPMPAPRFWRVIPSIRMMPVPTSSGPPGHSFTWVVRPWSSSIICPVLHPADSMTRGSAIPRPVPTNCRGASATRSSALPAPFPAARSSPPIATTTSKKGEGLLDLHRRPLGGVGIGQPEGQLEYPVAVRSLCGVPVDLLV